MSVRTSPNVIAPKTKFSCQELSAISFGAVWKQNGVSGLFIRLDQIHDYIVGKDCGDKLTESEVQSLAQACLARMDRDFIKSAVRVE